jgi:hypothetical protein
MWRAVFKEQHKMARTGGKYTCPNSEILRINHHRQTKTRIMMFPYINDTNAAKLIDSLAINRHAEVRVVDKKEEPIFGYWVTDPLLGNGNKLSFTPFLSAYVPSRNAFSDNQPTILSYANQIFEGSRPLSEFEEMVLAQTINRLVKREPSKSHRR